MTQYKQDMPPPGGYAPVTYKRVPVQAGFFNAKTKLAIGLVFTGMGTVAMHYYRERCFRERIEMRCVRTALRPMLHAEVDRAMLKQLKLNRDLEEKLMKDVEGWEVGKWRHSPVYLTLGPNEFFTPSSAEYFAHCRSNAMLRGNLKLLES